MASFRFLVFCLVIIYISCSAAQEDSKDIKPASRLSEFQKQCLESKVINARNNKIICLICTGFDPSCFGSSTNSTEDPTTAPPTSPPTVPTTEAPAEE